MLDFFKYDLSSGEIVMTGTCRPDELALQIREPGFEIGVGQARPGQVYRDGTVADSRDPDKQWTLVRSDRDRRLARSDWTQLPDVPLATKEAWASYRQALRDITLQPDPFHIVWPQAQI